MRKLLFLTCLAFVLGGCVSTNLTMLGAPSKYPAVDPDQVRVYLTKEDIKTSYVQLALINATGSTQWTNEQQMISAMKKKAAKVGANGIILGEINEPSAGTKVAASIFGVSSDRKGKVIAVRVFEEKQQTAQEQE